MSALADIRAILELEAQAREGSAPAVTRTPTAEALEATLAEFFEAATDEERMRGAGVVFAIARALAAGMSPQAVEVPVVHEPPVPVEVPVVDSAPAAEGEDGGAA